jgi:hypothetical protein
MSSQIKPILVRDNILMCKDEIGFAVEKGGQNVSVQRFVATSTSASSHTYTIQVPSHSTVVSRELLWHARLILTITGTPANGKYLVNIGQNGSGRVILPPAGQGGAYPAGAPVVLTGTNTDCLAPFPLHQACENMTCQINNTSVSMNTNQILDPLLRCMSREDLARWNSSTPVYLDNYGSNSAFTTTSELKLNSPFNGYDCVFDPNYPPRGAFPNFTITGNAVGDGNPKTVVLTFDLAEPIMLSPFVFGDVKHSSAGFYGVSQMNFTMQMDATAKRVLRWFNDTNIYPNPGNAGAKTLSSVAYDTSNCYIECRFLTPHPSTLLPELNVVPYANFTNFIKVGGALNNGASTTLQSDNIQLNSIPDKVLIYVKEAKANLLNTDADYYAVINSANITFNNQSGILSNASTQELWRMSVEAGSNQSWLEYNAKVQTQTAGGDSSGSNSGTGSVLVLDFATHINISEDYYAPASIGAFNFNIQVNVLNRGDNMTNAELNIVFLSSGVFTAQNGVSATYTGVLSKQMVLDASLQEPIGHEELQRYVGGGFLDGLKSAVGKVLPIFGKIARPLLEQVPHPAAQAASAALKAIGMGQTGGALSAGAATGGRRVNKHLM